MEQIWDETRNRNKRVRRDTSCPHLETLRVVAPEIIFHGYLI